LFFFLSRHAD
jgi:hypothetical protein